jgi:mannosylglucosylglycerate synthase
LVPNVMEFEQPPAPHDDYVATLRQDLGVEPGEYLVLQPTRIVQRKGIEHAIELIHRLDLLGLRCRMIISHAGGDEGDSYVQRVRNFAALMDVRLNIVADQIAPRRGTTLDGRKIYTLDDVYGQADLVTYPSTFEGFGNAFLEAVYFKRPVVVNSYSIFATDIKPKGFQVIEFDGYITDDTVREVRDLFENPVRVAAMGEHNYALARRYYSYSVLQRQLEYLLVDLFGVEHAGPGATGDAHATTAAAEAAHARAANKQAQSG